MDPSDVGLLELLYCAVANPGAWSQALGKITDRLGGSHAMLVASGLSLHDRSFVETAGLDEPDVARFTSDRARTLSQPLTAAMPQGRPVQQRELISDHDMEKADYYNEIVRPAGGFHSLTVLQGTNGVQRQLILCRSRSKGEFTNAAAEWLGRLLPHFNVVLVARDRLRLAESRSNGLSATLDSLNDGVILLGETGRIEFVNAGARSMIGSPENWLAHAKCLEDTRNGRRIRLRDALRMFQADPQRKSRRLYIERGDGNAGWIIIDILSLSRFGLRTEGEDAGRTSVLLRSTGGQIEVDRRALEDLHHLTARESQIAALLASGETVTAISDKTGLTSNTVRFYFKQIFAKMGVSNQAGLVAAVRPYTVRTRSVSHEASPTSQMGEAFESGRR
ncbi:LuxR C-terminal-related transcriptional regulator [Mesorhizobium loti]|nr:LuxR C-terminal-related transcriptional regulator [Mesorhizobium loti]